MYNNCYGNNCHGWRPRRFRRRMRPGNPWFGRRRYPRRRFW